MAVTELDTLLLGRYHYSDIPANFGKSVASNDLAASYDLRAINESLLGLVQTTKGERLFQPTVGCNINKQLFENINPAAAFTIKYNIETTIQQYEPRVQIQQVDVSPIYDQNTYLVTVRYRLRTDVNKEYEFSSQLRQGLV
ncbi:baseplate wedge subunit [Vibrio phage D479]